MCNCNYRAARAANARAVSPLRQLNSNEMENCWSQKQQGRKVNIMLSLMDGYGFLSQLPLYQFFTSSNLPFRGLLHELFDEEQVSGDCEGKMRFFHCCWGIVVRLRRFPSPGRQLSRQNWHRCFKENFFDIPEAFERFTPKLPQFLPGPDVVINLSLI